MAADTETPVAANGADQAADALTPAQVAERDALRTDYINGASPAQDISEYQQLLDEFDRGVAEAKAAAEAAAAVPDAEAESASATLGDLLRQIDATDGNPQKTTEQLQDEIAEADEAWRQFEQARATEAERLAREQADDLAKAAADLRRQTKAPASIPDRVVRGAIRQHCAEDAAALQAWEQRRTRPQVWAQHFKRIAAELPAVWNGNGAQSPASGDGGLRDDRARARASVHAANSRPVQPQEFTPQELFEMSDQDFRAYAARKAAEGDRLKGRR